MGIMAVFLETRRSEGRESFWAAREAVRGSLVAEPTGPGWGLDTGHGQGSAMLWVLMTVWEMVPYTSKEVQQRP